MRTRVALATAVLLAVSAPAAAAKVPHSALIKEGVGIAGVNLGMTEKAAIAKLGKPEGGKCTAGGPSYRNCSWSRLEGKGGQSGSASFGALLKSGKVVSLHLLSSGLPWKTKKGAQPSKTTFTQLQSLYAGISIRWTCAMDFGHVAVLTKGKKVTVFSASNATENGVAFDSVTIFDSAKTGYAQIDPGMGALQDRAECHPGATPPSGGGGPFGGGDPSGVGSG